MPSSHLLPPKREVLESLLDKCSSVFVHLDPRKEGVIAPKWLSSQAELILRLGKKLTPPITDLLIGEEVASCTLTFRGAAVWCALPWASIFAIVGDDGRGVVWPEDVPAESPLQKSARPRPKLAAVPDPPKEPAPQAPKPKKARKKAAPPPAEAATGRVEGRPELAPPADRPGAARVKRPLPPYLRVVK